MTFRKFVYEIDGLYPPEKPQLGGWAFNAYLEPEFALKASKQPLTEQNETYLQEEAREIIKRYGLNEMGEIEHPLMFFNKSWLVTSFRVPGNACDLSVTDSSKFDLERLEQLHQKGLLAPIGYMAHNIDAEKQAHCIASMFTNWANFTRNVLSGD